MLEISKNIIASTAKTFVFATACFTSNVSSLAQAGDPQKASQVSANNAPGKLDIPEEIQKKAKDLNIPLAAITFENNVWSACVKVPGKADSCIILGSKLEPSQRLSTPVSKLTNLRNGDTLIVCRYGEQQKVIPINIAENVIRSSEYQIGTYTREADRTFTFTLNPGVEARVSKKETNPTEHIDTLPNHVKINDRYARTKDISVVQTVLQEYSSEDIVVILSVPALCPPCRDLDKVVLDVSKNNVAVPKIITLEYHDFESGRHALGPNAIFPTILVYRSQANSSKTDPVILGDMNSATREQILEQIADHISGERVPSHIVRAGLFKDGFIKLLKLKDR